MADVLLTKDEIDKLNGHVDLWPVKTRTERDNIKERLVTEFLQARGHNTKDIYARAFLKIVQCQKIQTWLSNRVATRNSRLPNGLKTVWTAREVFHEKNKAAITARRDEILAQTGAGPEGNIGAFNQAKAQLWNELTAEERAEYEEEADKWTLEGPPSDLRAQIAEKRITEWAAAFVVACYDQVQAMTSVQFSYLDKMGELQTGRHDISERWHLDDPNVPRFIDLYPDWKSDAIGNFSDYCARSLNPDRYGKLEAPPPAKARVDYQFTRFPDDTPVLPPLSEVRRKKHRDQVLRAFLNLHWELAVGVKGSSVHWVHVVREPTDYIDEDFFVDEVVIKDPTALYSHQLEALWQRILDLQDNDTFDDRFHWTHVCDKKGNRRPASYSGPPEEKKKARGKRRAAVARRPPAAARLAGTRSGGDGDGSGDEDREAELGAGDSAQGTMEKGKGNAKGGRKVSRSSKPGDKGKGKAKEGDKMTAKEKAQARLKAKTKTKGTRQKGRHGAASESDTAQESGVEENDAADPDLSDSSGEDIDINNIPSGDDEDDEGPRAGPSTRRTQRRKPTEVEDSTRQPPRPRHVAPIVNGLDGYDNPDVPPDGALVELAKERGPNWVGQDPARVFIYLWSRNDELIYRRLLDTWRHMMRRRATIAQDRGPGMWAHWDANGRHIPKAIHVNRPRWDKLLTWIEDHQPSEVSDSQAVQLWFLVCGMAIHDIHIVNSIDPDPEEPVPKRGAEYLRESKAEFDDIARILRACANSHHGIPPAGQWPDFTMPDNTSDIRPVSADGSASPHNRPSTAKAVRSPPLSPLTALPPTHVAAVKRPTIKGARGGPPGTRVLPRVAEKTVEQASSASEDEVEQEVAGLLGTSSAGARSISEGLALQRHGDAPGAFKGKPYILVPSSAVARGTRSHKQMDDTSAPRADNGKGNDGKDRPQPPGGGKKRKMLEDAAEPEKLAKRTRLRSRKH
ncbi:hypothetical protein C8Q76DRAFT_697117 [Earliella scabrosa]|nr:hypothetical protein C8Q76DRAFT_697117 [Earliella scabrosa]